MGLCLAPLHGRVVLHGMDVAQHNTRHQCRPGGVWVVSNTLLLRIASANSLVQSRTRDRCLQANASGMSPDAAGFPSAEVAP